MKSPTANPPKPAAAPWWHKLPPLPRPYLCFLAAVANFTFGMDQDFQTNLNEGLFPALLQTFQDDIFQSTSFLGEPILNLLFYALLLYLNYEVLYMFLTKRFHKWETDQARREGWEQGYAAGQAALPAGQAQLPPRSPAPPPDPNRPDPDPGYCL